MPEPLRRQADTPWFRSYLAFSPATVIAKIKQPLLILHGTVDQEVASHHAAKLGEMAKAQKKVPAENARVVTFDGVNHLLVQSTSGELTEYRRWRTRLWISGSRKRRPSGWEVLAKVK